MKDFPYSENDLIFNYKVILRSEIQTILINYNTHDIQVFNVQKSRWEAVYQEDLVQKH